jgi:predicted chitinase
MDNIIKIKNQRISGFPDFVMDWIARQKDEVTTALLTPPNLTIVLPTTIGQNGQIDGSFKNFKEKFDKAYSAQTLDNMKAQMGKAYDSEQTGKNTAAANLSKKVSTGNKSEFSKTAGSYQNAVVGSNASVINKTQ